MEILYPEILAGSRIPTPLFTTRNQVSVANYDSGAKSSGRSSGIGLVLLGLLLETKSQSQIKGKLQFRLRKAQRHLQIQEWRLKSACCHSDRRVWRLSSRPLMNWVLFVSQALIFSAVVGRANLVESNRVEDDCTDDFNLGGEESSYSQFSTKPAALSSGRARMGTVELSPTHEIREGVNVVWQIPANPKAVLFLAHSAGGTPFSYWPKHPNAPKCKGTPEHVVVTREALERGFAVLAGGTSSATGEWDLWPASSSVDVQNYKKILREWTSKHGLEDLPLSAWGTSNGGDFVSSLAHEVKMHSLIVMISHGSAEAFEYAVAGEYPPTLFVPMIKDEKTFLLVKENVQTLNGKGIPSDFEEAPPQPVHPHFFSENIDELDEEQSAKLHSVFIEHGILDEDNFVKKVLMKHDVEPYLRKAGILPTVDDSQHQQDEEKLGANKSPKDGAAKEAGGDRGAPTGGRGGPPNGGRGGGRGPPSERGEAPPAGGRGRGRGPKHGSGPPPSHQLADGVANQLMVAQARHTLTARHDTKVFSWLNGEGWPNVQPH